MSTDAESQDPKKHVRRSPNYPYLALSQAIGKARTLHDSEHDHFVPVEAAARLWKLSPTSSSLQKTIAALTQYGLIEEKGSGSGRQVKVSGRALDILIRPDHSPERQKALRDAALAPKLHSELWEKYDKRLPKSDESLRVFLLREREDGVFNKDSVDDFLKRFRETLAFAKIDDGTTIGEAKDDSNKIVSGSFVRFADDDIFARRKVAGVSDDGEWVFLEGEPHGVEMSSVEAALHAPEPIRTQKMPPKNPAYSEHRDEPGIETERTNLPDGSVVLQWPTTLTQESVEEFEYWINGVLRRARRKAGLPPDPGKGSNPRSEAD
jgi:hypothetical protein